MKRDRDVRDRLIAATLAFASNEQGIRSLTKRMHASACATSPPCWASDDDKAWADPRAELPEKYCDACVRSTILRRERHALKVLRGARKETLLREASRFKGSIYGACAGPVAGSGGVNRDHDTGGPPCSNHPSTSTTLA
jgi:hypothetical protein